MSKYFLERGVVFSPEQLIETENHKRTNSDRRNVELPESRIFSVKIYFS